MNDLSKERFRIPCDRSFSIAFLLLFRGRSPSAIAFWVKMCYDNMAIHPTLDERMSSL